MPTTTITTGAPTSALTGFTVQSGGSGYTTPAVLISGGGGTGATATTRVSNGVITGVILTSPGTGYTTAPTVTFSDPSPRAKGAAATGVITVTPGPTTMTVTTGTGIRKFVDALPGLGPTPAADPLGIGPNGLGQYIPIATPDTTTFSGSDYYELELIEYTEKMHSDLPPTTLRGYRQTNMGGTPVHYLGPLIIATRNRPVRVKFTNRLPTGAGGDLFIPVDTTYMGAGLAPDGTNYTQNRATLHLHGGNTVWISDGTPHQWTTPAGETTNYPKGVAVYGVPDMPAAGPGVLTFFYSNQQSARLMFYHDHAYGITRLNVYAGEAAGYLLTDAYEQDLINGTNTAGANPTNLRPLPNVGIPLVIQDKTFVDATTIPAQDPTWNWGTGGLTGPLSGVTVTAGGTGYTTAPTVGFTGGGGTGATATATIAGGGVTGVTITNPGTGYTTAPTVTFSGGGGTGAAGTATIGGQTVSALTLNTSGSGYSSTPTVNFTGGGGTGAAATTTIGRSALTGIAVATPGSGYTTSPTVTISGGGGTGAAGTAIVGTSSVTGLTLTNGGARYTSATITFTGGGGTGAAAVATIAGGIITALTLTNAGSGYTSAPVVTISGNGTGATATASVLASAGTVTGITVTNAGTGYTSAPTVAISGGGGTGATATASVPTTAGTVTALTLTNGGTGYTSVPTVTISGGGGTGATATATVVSGVTGVTVTTAGTGYNTPPTVGFTGGGGTGAAATATIGGRVTSVTLTAGGSGYTSAPTVTFTGGGGIGATATVAISPGTARAAKTGDLWWPHVYMPNQNPYDVTGANPMGRWDYGPWFWPPYTGLQFGPVANPYYDPVNAPWEPPTIPGIPNPSGTPESFMDTPLINGTAYPTITVQPRVYRFRVLNACNDRFVNLQLYQATGIVSTIVVGSGGSGYQSAPAVTISGGGGTGATATATITGGVVTAITVTSVGSGYTAAPIVTIAPPTAGTTATAIAVIYTAPTEVGMLPANPGSWPADYPTPDGRAGGLPDPNTRGPAIIQIGTEGGFLPAPVVFTNRPVGYDYNRRSITVLNVLETVLFLGPAERADILVDFTNFAGKTLILYNDSPAPVPAFDPRIDYYTNDGDQTATGGAPNTIPGYGPNTRTIMQIQVAAGASSTAPANDYNPTLLTQLATALAATFGASQDTIIAPDNRYNAAYNGNFPSGGAAYIAIQDTSHTFTPIGQTVPITMPLLPKGIQELFTTDYGRMNALLSYEVPNTNQNVQTTVIQAYIDPPNEIMGNSSAATPIGALGDGTQIWKYTHNGVDTHAIHFHLFNVQLINRVGWDGAIKPPDDNEIGWKETVRMNPLEDAIVAIRPIAPNNHTFKLPNSVRLLDTTRPVGSPMGFTNVNPLGNPVTVTNQLCNFGWEYVTHCHLLGHEENDMMRPMCFVMPPEAPTGLTRTILGGGIRLDWTNNSLNATGNTIQRATDSAFTQNLTLFDVAANAVTYTDTTAVVGTPYWYRIMATNTVGTTLVAGYPTMTANSTPSNTVTGTR
jgi:FtsP/CotA-like multicopper oxidase with cupredoxin domain